MSSIGSIGGASSAWHTATTAATSHAGQRFAKVDTDASGGVDMTELQSMLDQIGKKAGTAAGDASELMNRFDSSGDGSLTSDELDGGMRSLRPEPASTQEFARQRGGAGDDLFAKVDTNGDGSLDASEMQGFIDAMTGGDSGITGDAALQALDADGSGGLSEAEFDALRPGADTNTSATTGTASAEATADTAQSTPPAGGPPPGPPPGGSPSGASSSDSSSASTDPLDTNGDGVVSTQERLVGELKEMLTEGARHEAAAQRIEQTYRPASADEDSLTGSSSNARVNTFA